jgi:glycosyltransferase involved in cell wall biosynthesis
MTDTPAVSVIITCYNYARFLPEAVASVVAQRAGGWELIIVDDGSTDETLAAAQRLRAQHAGRPIRLFSRPNGGISAARNCGARHARAEALLFLDADDLIAPELLERALPVLRARPEVGFVYSGLQRFGEDWSYWPSVPFSLAHLLLDNYVPPPALLRRAAWRDAGGFDERLPFFEDWDFWLRLAADGWLGHHIAAPLCFYRSHGPSLMGRSRGYAWDARAQIVRKHPRLYGARLAAWAERRAALGRLPAPRLSSPPAERELPAPPPDPSAQPPAPFVPPARPPQVRAAPLRRLIRAVPFGLRFRVKCALRRAQHALRATGLWL